MRQEVRLPQWVHFKPSSAGFATLERTFCQRPFYEVRAAVAVDRCNVTGFSLFEYEMSGKWLELLRQIAPRVTRAAVLGGTERSPPECEFFAFWRSPTTEAQVFYALTLQASASPADTTYATRAQNPRTCRSFSRRRSKCSSISDRTDTRPRSSADAARPRRRGDRMTQERERPAMKLPDRRKFLHLAAGAAALPALSSVAQAQAWPNRPVRLVVGFPAGGGADAAARIIAQRFSEVWGQQVVIENKGGAGGNIAIDAVAHASPDGYTILLGHPGLVINQFLYSSLTYDPLADFAPVSLIGVYGNLLVVSNSSALKTFPDFLRYARANPGKVTFATPGVGTSPHLAGELLKHRAGIEMTHVPYRGVAAGGMSDLVSGRVDSMFNTTGSLLQAARAGTVRALAVTLPERAATAPEIPTIAEAGVPGFDVSGWYGLLAPAKTRADILRKMHTDAAAVLADPALKAKFEPLGVDVGSSTPETFTTLMRAESELWGPIIKAANIKGE